MEKIIIPTPNFTEHGISVIFGKLANAKSYLSVSSQYKVGEETVIGYEESTSNRRTTLIISNLNGSNFGGKWKLVYEKGILHQSMPAKPDVEVVYCTSYKSSSGHTSFAGRVLFTYNGKEIVRRGFSASQRASLKSTYYAILTDIGIDPDSVPAYEYHSSVAFWCHNLKSNTAKKWLAETHRKWQDNRHKFVID